MLTLTVWNFDSPTGADAGAVIVELLAREGSLPLVSVATAVWEPDRSAPSLRSLHGAGDPGTVDGVLALLFWLVFGLPLVEATIGSPPRGALTGTGIGQSFANRVRDRVTPGTSALLLLSVGPPSHRHDDALGAGLFDEPLRIDLDVDADDVLSEDPQAGL